MAYGPDPLNPAGVQHPARHRNPGANRSRRQRNQRRRRRQGANAVAQAAAEAAASAASQSLAEGVGQAVGRGRRRARRPATRTTTEIGQTTPSSPAAAQVQALALQAAADARTARTRNLMDLYSFAQDTGGPTNPDIRLPALLRLREAQAKQAKKTYGKAVRQQAKDLGIRTKPFGSEKRTPAWLLEQQIKDQTQVNKRVKKAHTEAKRQAFENKSWFGQFIQAGVVGAGVPGVTEGNLHQSNVLRRKFAGSVNPGPLYAASALIPGTGAFKAFRAGQRLVRGAGGVRAAARGAAVASRGRAAAAAERAAAVGTRPVEAARSALAARREAQATASTLRAAARERAAAARVAVRQENRARGVSTAARVGHEAGFYGGKAARATGQAITAPLRPVGWVAANKAATAKGLAFAQGPAAALAASGVAQNIPVAQQVLNLASAPAELVHAAIEHPGEFVASTSQGLRDTLFGIPPAVVAMAIAGWSALPGTPGGTERLGDLLDSMISDIEARYGPLAEGDRQLFRDQMTEGYEITGPNGEQIHVPGGGAAPFVLDAMIAAPPIGRFGGTLAREGVFGTDVAEWATRARAAQRLSGDLRYTPNTSKNVAVIPFQRAADRLRADLTRRRATRAPRAGRIGAGDGLAKAAYDAGEITPLFQKLGTARSVAKVKGRAILEGKSIGADEVGRGFLRDVSKLKPRERDALQPAIALGIRTPEEARVWLQTRIDNIKAHRLSLDSPEFPKSWDNVPWLEKLIKHADDAFTERVAAIADQEVARGEQLARFDPTFKNLSAQVRAARPQGKMLGVARFTESDPTEFYREYKHALDSERGGFLTPYTRDQVEGYAPLPDGMEFERFLISDDGQVGAALIRHEDGKLEVGSLFRREGGPSGSGEEMVQLAIANGADYLTAFGEDLRRIYERNGFVVKEKYPFDPELAPEGWKPEDGKPNYYVMERVERGSQTDDTYQAVRDYQDLGEKGKLWGDLNAELKAGAKIEDMSTVNQDMLFALDSAVGNSPTLDAHPFLATGLDEVSSELAKTADGDYVFYRGITPLNAAAQKYLIPGKRIRHNEYMAASSSEAEGVANTHTIDPDRERILLKIEAPGRAKVARVNDILAEADTESLYPGENQGLFGRNSELEVVSVTKKTSDVAPRFDETNLSQAQESLLQRFRNEGEIIAEDFNHNERRTFLALLDRGAVESVPGSGSTRRAYRAVSESTEYTEVTVKLHPAQAWEAPGTNDPRVNFLERVDAAAKEAGLAKPGYFPSHTATDRRDYSVHAQGGAAAVNPVRQYQGILYDLGIEDPRLHILAEGYLRNIKNNTNWNLVGDLFAHHTIPETRNKSLFEINRWIADNRIDEGSVAIVNMRRFRESNPVEALDDDMKLEDFHIDPDAVGSESVAAMIDEWTMTPEEARNLAQRLRGHTSDPEMFKATSGYSVVPKAAWDELTSGMRQTLVGRVANIALTQKPSRFILGSLNIPWLKFQVISNGIVSGLVGGVGPVEWVKATAWWAKLNRAEKNAISPYLGDGSHFFPEESKLGAASTNRMVNTYRAFKESTGGAVLFGGKERPEGTVGRALLGDRRTIQARDLNPFNVLFGADRAQNNFFRRAVFYNDLKKAAVNRMSENAGAAARLQNKIAAYFQLDPEGQMRAMINDVSSGTNVIETHARHAADLLGDYTTFTSLERTYLKRYVMFYSFLRFSVRMAFYTLPAHHPVMTGLMGHLARLEAAEIQDLLGGDLLPYALGRYFMDDGALVMDFQRANPVMNALSQTVFGYGAQGKFNGLIGLFSPWAGAAYTQLSGQDAFTGRDIKIEGETTGRTNLGIPIEDRGRIFLHQALSLFFPYRVIEEIKAQGRPFGADHLVFSPRYTQYKDEEIVKAIRKRQNELDVPLSTTLFRAAFPEAPQPSRDITTTADLRDAIIEEARQLGSPEALQQASEVTGVPLRRIKKDASSSSGAGWYGG